MFGFKNIKFEDLQKYSSLSECTEQLSSKNNISLIIPFPNQRNKEYTKFSINKDNMQSTLDTNIYTLTNKNHPDLYLIIKNKNSNCGFQSNYMLPKIYIEMLEKMEIDYDSVWTNFALTYANKNMLMILVEKMTPIFNTRLNDSIKNNLNECADKGWFPTIESLNNIYVNSKNEIRIINHNENPKNFHGYTIKNCNDKGEIVQNPNNPNKGRRTYLNYLFEFFNERNCSKIMKCQDNICKLIVKIEEEVEPVEEPKEEPTEQPAPTEQPEPQPEPESTQEPAEEPKEEPKEEPEPTEEPTEEPKEETEPQPEPEPTQEPEPVEEEKCKNKYICFKDSIIEYINKFIDNSSVDGQLESDIKTYFDGIPKKVNFLLANKDYTKAEKIYNLFNIWKANACNIIYLTNLVELLEDEELIKKVKENEENIFNNKCQFVYMKLYTTESDISQLNECPKNNNCSEIISKLQNLTIKIYNEDKLKQDFGCN